jgi:hypothetical protein
VQIPALSLRSSLLRLYVGVAGFSGDEKRMGEEPVQITGARRSGRASGVRISCISFSVVITVYVHSFISNLSDDRSTASSKTIPPLNAI